MEDRTSTPRPRNSSRGYHMGTARARMSLDKSGRHREICHAGENRRGISRADRDDRRAVTVERGRRARRRWKGMTRLVGLDVSPRKHEGAAALYDASGSRPVFNLSETFWHKTIFTAGIERRHAHPERALLLPRRLARAATPSVNRQSARASMRSMWKPRSYQRASSTVAGYWQWNTHVPGYAC